MASDSPTEPSNMHNWTPDRMESVAMHRNVMREQYLKSLLSFQTMAPPTAAVRATQLRAYGRNLSVIPSALRLT